MDDLISRQAAIDALRLIPCDLGKRELEDAIKAVEQLPPTRTEPLTIRVNNELTKEEYEKLMHDIKDAPIVLLASAQPEIVKCKDCVYGEQDDIGRWFCRSLGCQVGDEDGSGFCADAERKKDNGETIQGKEGNR